MSDSAPDVRAISLARPQAGAVIYGPCRAVTLAACDFPIRPDGLIVAVHANAGWIHEDAERLRANLWPECSPTPGDHRQGLLGYARVTLILWETAAQEWRLCLDEPTRIRVPLAIEGYAGLYQLPDAIVAGIQKAWRERAL